MSQTLDMEKLSCQYTKGLTPARMLTLKEEEIGQSLDKLNQTTTSGSSFTHQCASQILVGAKGSRSTTKHES